MPGCLHGGTCVDGLAGYTCICPQGKTGVICEMGEYANHRGCV